MKTFKLLGLFTILILQASAQKENYIWYFGHEAGLDFNSGSPVALTNGNMNTLEGCSSISDSAGSLLFYTNGEYVWDRNHFQMPNGWALDGSVGSTQSALIIPFVGNNTLYYIFTVDGVAPLYQRFSYSIVDMTLNGGYGEVTLKNSLIRDLVGEKLCAVRHSNNVDIWIMVHGSQNDSSFAYLVTASGIASAPVINKIGAISDHAGYMKFSSDGTKLALANTDYNYVEVFDFNNTTGVLSNGIYLTLPLATNTFGAYGIEFSSNGQYLYATQIQPSHIYQWDISSNDSTMINSTLIQIGSSNSLDIGALQMAPDGKIYVARDDVSHFLGVINNPDLSGISSNYVDNGISLLMNHSYLGLPNFLASYFLSTGINSINPISNQLTFFPNPAHDFITINAELRVNDKVSVTDILGKTLFTKTLKSSTDDCQLTTANLPNGIYFIKVGNKVGKFVKQ